MADEIKVAACGRCWGEIAKLRAEEQELRDAITMVIEQWPNLPLDAVMILKEALDGA